MIKLIKVNECNFFYIGFNEFYNSIPEKSAGMNFVSVKEDALERFKKAKKHGETLLTTFDESRIDSNKFPYIIYVSYYTSADGKYLIINEIKMYQTFDTETINSHLKLITDELKKMATELNLKILLPKAFVPTPIGKRLTTNLDFKEDNGFFIYSK